MQTNAQERGKPKLPVVYVNKQRLTVCSLKDIRAVNSNARKKENLELVRLAKTAFPESQDLEIFLAEAGKAFGFNPKKLLAKV